MKVYVVLGGCVTDEHIIAIYTSEKKAQKRATEENKREKALEAYVETWDVSK